MGGGSLAAHLMTVMEEWPGWATSCLQQTILIKKNRNLMRAKQLHLLTETNTYPHQHDKTSCLQQTILIKTSSQAPSYARRLQSETMNRWLTH